VDQDQVKVFVVCRLSSVTRKSDVKPNQETFLALELYGAFFNPCRTTLAWEKEIRWLSSTHENNCPIQKDMKRTARSGTN
jgi:hypothetical protein